MFKRVDQNIANEFKKLKTHILTLELKVIKEFKLSEPIDDNWYKSLKKSQGIYLFEIKVGNPNQELENWIDDFKKKWSVYDKQWTPSTKEVRIKNHKELLDWMPLYIGKSKTIGTRIRNHIKLDLHKTTFALKLNSRKNLSNDMFRIKALIFDDKLDNYNAIAPFTEYELRTRINPIVGKQ